MVGLASGQPGQVGLFLPVASVVVIIHPMTERSARGRALAGDDDAIPVRVDFESGRHHAEILHTVLHPCAALGQEGDRQGAQMIFRGQSEGHAGRPAALVYVRGGPPLADDLAVIASDRDHIMLP